MSAISVDLAMLKLYAIRSLMLLFFTPISHAVDWNTSVKTDPFNDDVVHKAELINSLSRSKLTIICDNSVRVYHSEPRYLSDDISPVRYRFDNKGTVNTQWLPSTTGKALFVPESDITYFLVELLQSNSWLIETKNYRETRDLYKYSYVVTEGLRMVVSQCLPNLEPPSIDDLPGVAQEVIDSVHEIPDKRVVTRKRQLTMLGFYEGEETKVKSLAFYQAHQDYYNVALTLCEKEGAPYAVKSFCNRRPIILLDAIPVVIRDQLFEQLK